MLYKKISVPNVGLNNAFSLIEILISLALGTIILFSISKFYSDHYLNHTKQRELLRLQKYTHQLLDYFQQHIQHIGYQGQYRENSNFHLFLKQDKPYLLHHSSCFIFMYDLNGDGCIGERNRKNSCHNHQLNNTRYVAKEIFGFKLENRLIAFFDDDTNIRRCYGKECLNKLNDCNQLRWSKISDLSEYYVDKLTFEWIKENELLKIELSTSSIKMPHIKYNTTAYSYLLNARK